MDNNLKLTAIAAVLACTVYRLVFRKTFGLSDVPTLGNSNPVLSYLDAYRFVAHGRDLLAEGYTKFKGGFFKVAMLDKIVSGPMAEELRRLPDDKASFHEFVKDSTQIKYTMGQDVADNPYHVELVQSRLTKRLAAVFTEVYDEVDHAFKDVVPNQGSEWVTMPAESTLRTIVCRASNRIFVGLPLCRDPDYMTINMRYAVFVNNARNRINLFPQILKPIAAAFYANLSKSTADAARHLRPIIEERQRMYDEYGPDYPEKPDDMITWMMDVATGKDRSPEALTRRTLVFNFAAIHTSTSTITHTLYSLAANPEYVQPLREEVERVVQEDGWTKVAMTKMHKIDSFIKEVTRYNTFVGLSIMRKMRKDHTFSDGTRISKGTFLGAPTQATHSDQSNYGDPLVFNPWRFSKMREADGESAKHQFVNTSPEYIPFGHGKHACPGRFFAANELKLILAYIVVNYDVQLEHGSRVRPPNVYFATSLHA